MYVITATIPYPESREKIPTFWTGEGFFKQQWAGLRPDLLKIEEV